MCTWHRGKFKTPATIPMTLQRTFLPEKPTVVTGCTYPRKRVVTLYVFAWRPKNLSFRLLIAPHFKGKKCFFFIYTATPYCFTRVGYLRCESVEKNNNNPQRAGSYKITINKTRVHIRVIVYFVLFVQKSKLLTLVFKKQINTSYKFKYRWKKSKLKNYLNIFFLFTLCK